MKKEEFSILTDSKKYEKLGLLVTDNIPIDQKSPGIKKTMLTSCNVFRAFVAIGILAVPYAISLVGIGPGLIIIILVSLYLGYCMHLLMSVAENLNLRSGNYEEVGAVVWGPWGERLILTILGVICFSAYVSAILFLISFLQSVLCESDLSQHCWPREYQLLFSYLLNLLPIMIEKLIVFGFVSVISSWIILCTLLGVCFISLK